MDKIRQEAYHIISQTLKKDLRSEILLGKSSAKMAKAKDKLLLYHLVKGTLKMKLSLDYIAENLCDKNKYKATNLKIKTLLYLGLYQLKYSDGSPDHHVINETVELAKTLYGKTVADFVNAVLREYQRRSDPINIDHYEDLNDEQGEIWLPYPKNPVDMLAVKYSFSPELISRWIDLWPIEEVEQLCKYFNQPAKLSIRYNRMATDIKRFVNYFKRKEIILKQSPLTSSIYLTEHYIDTLNDVSFNEGYFSVQDASAALTVELLNPQQDESILDLFAGPGGKCTYISELTHNTGEVIAVDKYPKKVRMIKQNLHRLQITNTITVTEDALKYAPRAAAYDRVLLDVPCSGWGVLQKKPELRWQNKQDMKSLLKLQEHALSVGPLFVKPGGYLMYSTCTMNRKENEDQVERFLDSNKDFNLVDAADRIPKKYTDKGYLRTVPHRDKADGAFAALMRKKDK